MMQSPTVLRNVHCLLGRCLSCCQKQSFPRFIASSIQHTQCRFQPLIRKIDFWQYSTAMKADKSELSSSLGSDVKSDESASDRLRNESKRVHTNPAREAKLQEEKQAKEILENLSPERAKKLKVLKLEYDILLSGGGKIPKKMTNTMWLKLLESETVTSRNKLYKFWFIKEAARCKEEEKKEERRAKHLARLKERVITDDGPYPNKILKKINDDDYHKHNFAFSMIHGPHLVMDLSYDNMREREARNLISQFLKCHGYNKTQTEPFHFHFCNVKRGSLVAEVLHRYFVNLDSILYTVSEQSYLDFYPHKNLVYLSPYAKQTMTNFSYDDIYILGGMVDKVSELPFSIAKAKKDRLRCVKLPLDKYLQWTKGSKALTLDQMVMILHTLKKTNDWIKAFEHVPKRKFLWLHEQKRSNDQK